MSDPEGAFTGAELTEVLERYFAHRMGDWPCVLTDWVVCVAVRNLETGATGVISAPWGSQPTILGLLDLARQHQMAVDEDHKDE